MSANIGTNQIIVIRGPSAAGKSTISKELLRIIRHTDQRRCAYLEKDYFRMTITGDVDQSENRALSIDLLTQSARVCMGHGYDVVIEGILNIKHYQAMFDSFRAEYGMEMNEFFSCILMCLLKKHVKDI